MICYQIPDSDFKFGSDFIQIRLIVDYEDLTNSSGAPFTINSMVRRDILPRAARDRCHQTPDYQRIAIFLLMPDFRPALSSSNPSSSCNPSSGCGSPYGYPSTPRCHAASSPGPTSHCFSVLEAIKSPVTIQPMVVSFLLWSRCILARGHATAMARGIGCTSSRGTFIFSHRHYPTLPPSYLPTSYPVLSGELYLRFYNFDDTPG